MEAISDEELTRRIIFMGKAAAKRSAELLLAGAISGFLGFAFAGFLGIWKFDDTLQRNFRGELMPSGHNYFPETVSEMVNDPHSPAGKCFFAFGTIASICILSSYYPYYLRNVYTGDDKRLFGISWTSLRTFLPPIGLLLTVGIPARTLKQADLRDYAATGVHCMGAGMMIGGFCVFEFHDLLVSRTISKQSCEWAFRMVCVIGVLISGAGFVTLGYVSLNASKFGICCSDEWRVPTAEDIRVARFNGYEGFANEAALARDENMNMLVNAASSVQLVIKIAEYWCEVFSGLWMVLGLFVTWWFCEVRHIDLAENIPDASCLLLDQHPQ